MIGSFLLCPSVFVVVHRWWSIGGGAFPRIDGHSGTDGPPASGRWTVRPSDMVGRQSGVAAAVEDLMEGRSRGVAEPMAHGGGHAFNQQFGERGGKRDRR